MQLSATETPEEGMPTPHRQQTTLLFMLLCGYLAGTPLGEGGNPVGAQFELAANGSERDQLKLIQLVWQVRARRDTPYLA
jgi:hypothetical protein